MYRCLTSLILSAMYVGIAIAVPMPRELEIRVSTDKAEYYAYEPVIVRYDVHNRGGEHIEVRSTLLNLVGFDIAREGASYGPYVRGPEILVVAGKTRSLARAATMSATKRIVKNSLRHPAYRGARTFPFDLEGRYLLRAGVVPRTADDVLHSEPITISVLPAHESLTYFETIDDYVAAIGEEHSTPSQGDIERWLRFLDVHPNSPYAPYVAFHVGTIYLKGRVSAPNPQRAGELFSKTAAHAPKTLKLDCLLGLAKSQIEAGMTKEAMITAERILQLSPTSEMNEQAVRIRDGVAKGYKTWREINSNE